MGIYFIAAGASSKNREKTLDKPHTVGEICKFLKPQECDYLKKFFSEGSGVYIWGASEDLSQLEAGEYVVDVKNTEVVQVFRYCFYVKTSDTRLQEFLGWDSEMPRAERRPYPYVFFLKSPLQTICKTKRYFQDAFNLSSNPQWLVRQKYFDEGKVMEALGRTVTSSVEQFLGITTSNGATNKIQVERSKPDERTKASISSPEPPDWLKDLANKVIALKNDPGHLERDHEDLVASLFELLGYRRIHDIKFRRGNIDIRIEKNNTPLITVEVKADWSLSPDNRGALNQAYNYALETGTPFVIITNGDRYCIYDRRQGMSYKDNLIADLTITRMDQDGTNNLESLRSDRIK